MSENILQSCFKIQNLSDTTSRNAVWTDVYQAYGLASAPSTTNKINLKQPFNPSCNPIPLQSEHIEKMNQDPNSYVVSEKTDGVRALLWLGIRPNSSGTKSKTHALRARAEFIDRNFNVYKPLIQVAQDSPYFHKHWCGLQQQHYDKNLGGEDEEMDEDNTIPDTVAATTTKLSKHFRSCWMLLDGEFINEGVITEGKEQYVFLVFDVIVAHGKRQSHFSLHERHDTLRHIIRQCSFPIIIQKRPTVVKNNTNTLSPTFNISPKFLWRVELKPFYPIQRTMALWNHLQRIIPADDSFPPITHATDGLIFTPVMASVGYRRHHNNYYDNFASSSQRHHHLATLKYKPVTTIDVCLCWKIMYESIDNNTFQIALLLADDRYASAYEEVIQLPLIWICDTSLKWQEQYHLPASPTLQLTLQLLQWLKESGRPNGQIIAEFSVNIHTGMWCFDRVRPDRTQPNSVTVCVKTLQSLLNPVQIERICKVAK